MAGFVFSHKLAVENYSIAIIHMDNGQSSSEGKTQNITLGLIASWGFGILFLVPGIIMVFSAPVAGLALTVAGALLLPLTYNFIADKLHLSLSRGVQIVVVLILLGVAGAYGPATTKSSANAPIAANTAGQTEQPVVESIKVTALQLSNAYKGNEVAADATYKSKQVEIMGTVESIGKDILDTPYIALESYEYAIIDKVQCMFTKADEPQLATVSKGQKITLRGEVSGKFGNIIVKSCAIVR